MMAAISLAVILACAPPEVAPETIQAVIRVESGGDTLAVGINWPGQPARSLHPRTLSEALAVSQEILAQGGSVDFGLMQVNSRNLATLGYTLTDMFDPCANIRAGATILQDNYRRALQIAPAGQPALRAALGAYNSGDFGRGFANGYVARYEGNPATMPAVDPFRASSRVFHRIEEGASSMPPPPYGQKQ
jgi:type IV secretion system protein VirB1